jgi:hypothetical protein
MKHHSITILFLVLAIILYAFGFAVHGTVLVILGMAAELVFWIRAITSFKNRNKSSENQ